MSRTLIAVAALLAAPLLAAPVHGQTAPAQAAAPELEAARRVVARLLPDGTYRKMLGENMAKMMETVAGSMDGVPVATLAKLGGLSEEDAKTLGEAKMGEVMALYDPYWKERLRLTQTAMFAAMGDLFGRMEPRIREGMARAYAAKFSLAELQELDRFFATPAGGRYAAESLLIQMDPEVVKEMGALMPELMTEMPKIMERVKEATARLPEPRKVSELSPAERTRLSQLLGVPEDQLTDPDAEVETEEARSEDPVS